MFIIYQERRIVDSDQPAPLLVFTTSNASVSMHNNCEALVRTCISISSSPSFTVRLLC